MHEGVFLPIILVLAWVALALATPRLLINPRADVATGLAWHFNRLYVRLVHRLRVEGLEHVPRWKPGDPPVGPLVIVSNHTAGVDPLLIEACCVFEIRWMMLSDMMGRGNEDLWEWLRVIPVGGRVPGSQSARAAIKCLQQGEAVGVFPEGGIERPARTILPFEPGVGLLIHKTGARVLQAIIDGTPDVPHAYQSLFRFSRARVRFLPVRSFQGSGLGPKEIAAELQATLVRETGWLEV